MEGFGKDPYDIVVAKLKLAELTLKLGEATRQKWLRLGTMKDALKEEEDLIRQVAEETEVLKKMIETYDKP